MGMEVHLLFCKYMISNVCNTVTDQIYTKAEYKDLM